MTELRNQLKAVLAGQTTQEGSEPLPPAHELAERIKSLKAANTIEASAGRAESRGPIAAVEPVTTRIRRRIPKSPALESVIDDQLAAAPVEIATQDPTVMFETAPVNLTEPTFGLDEPVFPELAPPHQWRTVARPKRRLERQLSML